MIHDIKYINNRCVTVVRHSHSDSDLSISTVHHANFLIIKSCHSIWTCVTDEMMPRHRIFVCTIVLLTQVTADDDVGISFFNIFRLIIWYVPLCLRIARFRFVQYNRLITRTVHEAMCVMCVYERSTAQWWWQGNRSRSSMGESERKKRKNIIIYWRMRMKSDESVVTLQNVFVTFSVPQKQRISSQNDSSLHSASVQWNGIVVSLPNAIDNLTSAKPTPIALRRIIFEQIFAIVQLNGQDVDDLFDHCYGVLAHVTTSNMLKLIVVVLLEYRSIFKIKNQKRPWRRTGVVLWIC